MLSDEKKPIASVRQTLITEGKKIEVEYQQEHARREAQILADRQAQARHVLEIILPDEMHSQIVLIEHNTDDARVYFTVGDLSVRYSSDYQYFDVLIGRDWWAFKGYSNLCMLLARETK